MKKGSNPEPTEQQSSSRPTAPNAPPSKSVTDVSVDNLQMHIQALEARLTVLEELQND